MTVGAEFGPKDESSSSNNSSSTGGMLVLLVPSQAMAEDEEEAKKKQPRARRRLAADCCSFAIVLIMDGGLCVCLCAMGRYKQQKYYYCCVRVASRYLRCFFSAMYSSLQYNTAATFTSSATKVADRKGAWIFTTFCYPDRLTARLQSTFSTDGVSNNQSILFCSYYY